MGIVLASMLWLSLIVAAGAVEGGHFALAAVAVALFGVSGLLIERSGKWTRH